MAFPSDPDRQSFAAQATPSRRGQRVGPVFVAVLGAIVFAVGSLWEGVSSFMVFVNAPFSSAESYLSDGFRQALIVVLLLAVVLSFSRGRTVSGAHVRNMTVVAYAVCGLIALSTGKDILQYTGVPGAGLIRTSVSMLSLMFPFFLFTALNLLRCQNSEVFGSTDRFKATKRTMFSALFATIVGSALDILSVAVLLKDRAFDSGILGESIVSAALRISVVVLISIAVSMVTRNPGNYSGFITAVKAALIVYAVYSIFRAVPPMIGIFTDSPGVDGGLTALNVSWIVSSFLPIIGMVIFGFGAIRVFAQLLESNEQVMVLEQAYLWRRPDQYGGH